MSTSPDHSTEQVALPTSLLTQIDSEIASGRCRDRDDFVTAAVRKRLSGADADVCKTLNLLEENAQMFNEMAGRLTTIVEDYLLWFERQMAGNWGACPPPEDTGTPSEGSSRN